MRSLVDRRVNAHLETRTLRTTLWHPSSGAGTAYTLRNEITNLSCATLIPRIRQAVTIAGLAETDLPTRVGNQISPKSLFLKIRLFQDPGDTVQGMAGNDRAMIQPYVFVGTHKACKSHAEVTENNWGILNEFWRHSTPFSDTDQPAGGLGDATSFTGYREHFLVGELNRTKFSPIKGGVKTFEMLRPLGWVSPFGDPASGYGAAGFTIPYTGREFTFNIPMPKILKYSENTDEYPANYCPFIAIGFTYMNGAFPSAQAPLRCESSVKFTYTDA